MRKKVTLKFLNSFSIDVLAHCIKIAYTEAQLFKFWQRATENSIPVLLLGGGNNVLFLKNYSGIVLLNRITGIKIKESADAWCLHVGAGEIWETLVDFCLKKRIPGLENLALIPGYVGSAPIQNIGAYGVSIQQFCEYVDVLQLETGIKYRLSTTECQFGYRDSIFKHDLRENFAIIAVGIRLVKDWKPTLNYDGLNNIDTSRATPYQIYNAVCALRRIKLPDPSHQGNAGSFFKNPIITAPVSQCFLSRYPDAPYYSQSNNTIKLAAGWLIDRCGLKGHRLGGAAVHEKQASVLVNANKATGTDIASLSYYVRSKVMERFDIFLEPEVCFIGVSD